MNLQEFNSLETGDKITNAMTNGEGTVTAVTELRTGRNVKVKWGDGPGSVEFNYATHSTAWMHWSTVPKADFEDCGRRGGNCQCQTAEECAYAHGAFVFW